MIFAPHICCHLHIAYQVICFNACLRYRLFHSLYSWLASQPVDIYINRHYFLMHHLRFPSGFSI